MRNEAHRSLSTSQTEILQSVLALHCPDGVDADITFGNGVFWRDLPLPRRRFDIDPQVEGVEQASSTMLPLESESIGSVVFDPPFLTYVRTQREGNGGMVMARRFSGYWTFNELTEHYRETLSECARVLRPKGVLVVKCQDIIHNHKMHAVHASVIAWAEFEGFRLRDLFVLGATHRMPSPNRKGTQKHARVFHSYFLVFEKIAKRKRQHPHKTGTP